jgi:cold shock CspA family protein
LVDDSSSSTSDDVEFKTGIVKFYIRQKSYGFLKADGDGAEFFCHRSSIVSPYSPSESPFHPYLKGGERVRFKVEADADKPLLKAVNLTFEDGTEIPLYRDDFMKHFNRVVYNRLGEAVFEIMAKEGLDDDEKIAQVFVAYSKAAEQVEMAKNRVESGAPPLSNPSQAFSSPNKGEGGM